VVDLTSAEDMRDLYRQVTEALRECPAPSLWRPLYAALGEAMEGIVERHDRVDRIAADLLKRTG